MSAKDTIKRAAKLSALRTMKALGLFALSRRLTKHKLRILCYHGISVADEHLFRP